MRMYSCGERGLYKGVKSFLRTDEQRYKKLIASIFRGAQCAVLNGKADSKKTQKNGISNSGETQFNSRQRLLIFGVRINIVTPRSKPTPITKTRISSDESLWTGLTK